MISFVELGTASSALLDRGGKILSPRPSKRHCGIFFFPQWLSSEKNQSKFSGFGIFLILAAHHEKKMTCKEKEVLLLCACGGRNSRLGNAEISWKAFPKQFNNSISRVYITRHLLCLGNALEQIDPIH